MKITHWGEDYATLKIGKEEFEVSKDLACAIEKHGRWHNIRLFRMYNAVFFLLEKMPTQDREQFMKDYKYLKKQYND